MNFLYIAPLQTRRNYIYKSYSATQVEANFEFLAGFYATFAAIGIPKHAIIKAIFFKADCNIMTISSISPCKDTLVLLCKRYNIREGKVKHMKAEQGEFF